MGRTLLGELRKLLHPVVAIVMIVCFAYILTDARTTYYYAQLQTPVAVIAGNHIKQDAARCLNAAATHKPTVRTEARDRNTQRQLR